MANFTIELKRKIADLYLENRKRLEESDAAAMESFASDLLKIIGIEREKAQPFHDLEVLEESMRHLKQDSAPFKRLEPETDDYDFAFNDCKNLINATKRWLQIEGLM